MMRTPGIVIAAACALLVADVAAADDLELRRPYADPHPVSFGFDNAPGSSGCTDYECGSTCYDGHGGSDFPLVMGTEVLAGADGTVTATNNSCDDWGYLGNTCGGRCGNYVQLQHANGDFTIYCHMQRNTLTVSTGDTVTCGDVLGQSASSGSSTGPHLHLGWRPGGGSSTDVYAGSCNNSPGAWKQQNGYDEPVSAECACVPSTEVCDGTDNNCDGTVDSGDVCEVEMLHQAPHAYNRPSSTDVDGDGIQNVCARFHAGFRCFRPGDDSGWPEVIGTEILAESDGWGSPEYYSTVRMGDVDGDGLADVCARHPDGLTCWRSTGDDFQEFDTISSLSDDNGWHRPQYYTTLRLADIDGDGRDDVCIRAAAGWRCYLSTDDGFGERIDGPAWTDDAGFDRARYYGTIRTGDVDGSGRDDVCIRGPDGFGCYRFTGDDFERFATAGGMADEHGWGNIIYWPSIRLADIDGDGTMAVCARDSSSLFCRRFDGDDFGSKLELGGLSNDSGWSDPTNYATLRAGDVTGDESDELCIRANAGMLCYRVDGDEVTRFDGPEWSNANGWEPPANHGPTFITNIDDNRRGALCGRSSDGLVCETYDDESFGPAPSFSQFTDDGSWYHRRYYSTIRMGEGPCRADLCDEPEPDPDPDSDTDDPQPDADGSPTADVGFEDAGYPEGDSDDASGEANMTTSSSCACQSTSPAGLLWPVVAGLFGLWVWRRRRRLNRLLIASMALLAIGLTGCDSPSESAEPTAEEPVANPAEADGEEAAAGSLELSDDLELLAIHGDWRVLGDPLAVPARTDGPRRFEPVLTDGEESVDWPVDTGPISEAVIVGDEPTLFAIGVDGRLQRVSLGGDDRHPQFVDDHVTSQIPPAHDGCCVGYLRHADRGQQFRVYDLDEKRHTDTALGFSLGWAPAISEGAQRLAWTASPQGHASILVDEPGGDDPTAIVNPEDDLAADELSPFPTGVYAPVWTPDGIAFSTDDELWLVDETGDFIGRQDADDGMFWDESRQQLIDRHGEPIAWD